MSRYIVFEPPAKTGEEGPSEKARFVRDGFSGWAVLFPFLWLFRHGLVVSGLTALVLWLGFAALGEIAGLRFPAAALPLLLGVLAALEGPSLRAARLRRKGFHEAVVVEADNETEAAILYYATESNRDATESMPSVRQAVMAARLVRPFRAASLLDPPRRAT